MVKANRCVSCGLCLPHCPTYRLTMSEADSPRGRIALMSGVASGGLPMNKRFVQHMDRCLTCRACEAVCPNNVAYGQMIDAARAMIVASSNLRNGTAMLKKSWLRKWLENGFIAKPTRFDQLRTLLRMFQKSGLQQRLQQSNLLGKSKFSKLIAQLPSSIKDPYVSDNNKKGYVKSWQAIYPAVGKQRGEVGLFLGCVARLADVEALNSTIFVLNRLGYTVHVPTTQTCCGALHQHGGDVAKARTLARQNRKAFGVLNLSKIITTASGCGVQLMECDANTSLENNHFDEEAEKENRPDLSSRVIDVSKFLASVDGWEDVDIKPLASKIAVQEPCSLRNVLRDQAHVYALLERIPKIRVTSLAGNDQCCGAAGTYFIDQPDFAMKLQAEKILAINENNIRYLVTSNIGCSLHIASGLRVGGSNVEVLHPVTLLARQMGIQ